MDEIQILFLQIGVSLVSILVLIVLTWWNQKLIVSIEKAKKKAPSPKNVRILPLDCYVSEDILKKLKKDIGKDPLFKEANIFVDDVYDPCFYHNFSGEEGGPVQRSKCKDIENFSKKRGKTDYWELYKLTEELKDINDNEDIFVLAITTLPIEYDGEKFIGKGVGGVEDEFPELAKKETEILGSKAKIALVAYEKKYINENPGEVTDNAKHQLAHLLGISNYGFIC